MPSVDAQLSEAAKPASTLPKSYPQFNEDGTPKLNEDGSRVYGPEKAKKIKAAKPKAEKPKKLWPQWNEDGTPQLDAEGNQVQGETRMAKPKPPKVIEYQKDANGEFILDAEGNKIPVAKVRAPRAGTRAPTLECNGKPYSVQASQNSTELKVIGNVLSREGSKRSERAKAYEGATTVQEFFINKGLIKDLYRHLKAGVIELTFEGHKVEVVGKAAEPAAAE